MASSENVAVLKLTLHKHTVGYLAGYQGGRNVFIFDEGYRASHSNLDKCPTMTLTTHPKFPKSKELINEVWVKQQRLHPVFSNLLPEGAYRQWLAQTLKIHPDIEFPMLAQLGGDLPGALVATAMEPEDIPHYALEHRTSVTPIAVETNQQRQRFSLAGEQMKFSMKAQDGRYHVSQQGELGEWIIKTPSTHHRFVPQNEFTAMKLASIVGIEIPEVRLVPIKDLENLPPINLPNENLAYAIRRFDRGENGKRIHAEDFAQVLFKYPHDKYQSANYEQLAKVLYQYSGSPLKDVQQLARRLLANILLANGDAHLKNWSLTYKDNRTPELAPAYDIVTTRQYIRDEVDFALNLGGAKSWYSVSLKHFEQWANAADIPWRAIHPQLIDVMDKARELWPRELQQGQAEEDHVNVLKDHWKKLHKDFRI